MIRLTVFDIDGTLIPFSTHELASETKEAIQKLKQKGIYTAIASGRSYQAIQPEIRALPFDYYICANGAYITDSAGSVLIQHQIDSLTAEALVQDMIEKDYPIAQRYVDGTRSCNPNRDLLEYTKYFFSKAQLESAIEQEKKEMSVDRSGQLPIAFVCHIDQEDVNWFERRHPTLNFIPVNGGMLCDVINAGVNKGVGLRDICSYLNLDTGDCLAFGDDINDIDLLQTAGIGVAMGNAFPGVKNVANELTDSCEDLGVVKVLKKYGLLT